jgi:hypothetical protein
MGKVCRRAERRRRIGRVSMYKHRRRWWVYYREHGRPVRKAVADDAAAAEQVAAQINLELSASAPTLFSFRPVTVVELQQSFIDYHEHVVRSSLATVSRYRAATRHLVNFCQADGARNQSPAHEIEVEPFVRYLRTLRVAPNGHAHSPRRPLRDNGVGFILETCRSLYGYAAKRHNQAACNRAKQRREERLGATLACNQLPLLLNGSPSLIESCAFLLKIAMDADDSLAGAGVGFNELVSAGSDFLVQGGDG